MAQFGRAIGRAMAQNSGVAIDSTHLRALLEFFRAAGMKKQTLRGLDGKILYDVSVEATLGDQDTFWCLLQSPWSGTKFPRFLCTC